MSELLDAALWAIPGLAVLILTLRRGGPLPTIAIPPPSPTVAVALAAVVWLAVLVLVFRGRRLA